MMGKEAVTQVIGTVSRGMPQFLLLVPSLLQVSRTCIHSEKPNLLGLFFSPHFGVDTPCVFLYGWNEQIPVVTALGV